MIIILTVAMPISIVAQAEPSTERSYIQTSTVFSEKSLDDMLDLYTEFRADTLRKNKKVLLTDPAEKKALSGNGTVRACTEIFDESILADERRREPLIQDMENRLALSIVDAYSETEIISQQSEGNKLIVDCYVKTFFNYKDISRANDPEAPVDLSGFGTYHTLTFIKGAGNRLRLIEDSYDEGPLTNMKSSSYTSQEDTTLQTLEETYSQIGIANPSVSVNAPKGPDDDFSYWYGDRAVTYHVREGVAYSDKYALSYNPNFKNFNSSGGDCVNFASQCFDAATRQQCRNTSFKPYTSAWISSTASMKYWTSGNRGFKMMCTPSRSFVGEGQFVWYDWEGKGGGNTFYHTAYCVGKDSNNVYIVNSHNADLYHIRWNFGGSKCLYATSILRG